jgi:hypothetical protein
MKSPKHLSRQDVVILSLSILFLLNIAAVGGLGRHRARQAVCLSNLGQVTSAWLAYAGDNDGGLVSGEAGITISGKDGVKKPWVGKCWDSYTTDVQLPQEIQRKAIRDGALWPYVEEVRLYSCPDGQPGQLQTCLIVDSMNGIARQGTFTGAFMSSEAKGVKIGDTVLWIRNLAEIVSPGPAQRMVFIDQGWSVPGSHSVHYTVEAWWTPPPVRHWDGTSVTFADGHADRWRWQGQETILNGRGRGPSQFSATYTLATPEDKEDLHRLQIAVWGRLGY